MQVDSGELYAEFNAHNAGSSRGFAHDYSREPWQFNTYNRMEFWIKVPANGPAIVTTGQNTYHIGTYNKTHNPPEPYSDETGNNHWYHYLVMPPNGHWTRVVLNHHPSHLRGGSGGTEWGIREYTTLDSAHNYFDSFTRWYINGHRDLGRQTAVYHLDEITFRREVKPQALAADTALYSLVASYGDGRLFLSASSNRTGAIWHEVRWARQDIYSIGWDAAIPAPSGRIRRPGTSYNIMTYQTDSLRFSVGDTVYLGIRPEGSPHVAQIVLPILDSLGKAGPISEPGPELPTQDTAPAHPRNPIPPPPPLADTCAGVRKSLDDTSLQLANSMAEIAGLRAALLATRDSLAASRIFADTASLRTLAAKRLGRPITFISVGVE